jgi:hypothetical protein
VSLSDKALAMMNGSEVKEIAPTYVRPETARSILSQSEASKAKQATNAKESNVIDNRFSEMMQNILDKRLGIDRERLEEL